MSKILRIISLIFCLACFFSCTTRVSLQPPPLGKEHIKIQFVKYSIQVGAFHSFSNADTYSRKLNQYVDAFCFKDKDEFFKVRFGNYSSKANARKKAEKLKKMNIIDEYFIILPEKYKNKYPEATKLRKRIVADADSYIGIPYSWGGEDPATGFDCSGLTFSVYRESGIMLPRTSREQYKTGMFVLKKHLKKGDLVFFKNRGKAISHVGIYAGRYKFIHSPGKGKTVCYQSLNSSYYQRHYAGARTYFN